MNIRFTKEAEDAVRRRMQRDHITLKLLYDVEGCGCGVSGVPILYALDEVQDEAQAECDAFPVYYNEQQKIFFEEQLIIDVNQQTPNVFVLKSKGQIYSGNMALKTQH